ncbi:MAG: hypothetical protein ACRC32_11145 [Chroococcidiopsis sp.]
MSVISYQLSASREQGAGSRVRELRELKGQDNSIHWFHQSLVTLYCQPTTVDRQLTTNNTTLP